MLAVCREILERGSELHQTRRWSSAPRNNVITSRAHGSLMLSMSEAQDVRIRVRHKGFQDIPPTADHCNMSITTQPVDNNAKRKTSIPPTARRRLSQSIYRSLFAPNLPTSNLLLSVLLSRFDFSFLSTCHSTSRLDRTIKSLAYPTLIKRFQSTCVSTSPWPLPSSALL